MKVVVEDESCIPLLFILALFYPGQVELKEEEWRLVQHYHQKATFLIHKHLMSK